MSDLDRLLDDVWTQTSTHASSAIFNAAVFERIARRRAQRELGVAVLIAFAVWVIAMGLAPAALPVLAPVSALVTSVPVLIAGGLVVGGLGIFMVKHTRLEPGWWHFGFKP